MYLADQRALKHNRTPINPKVIVSAPGGGLQVYRDARARPFSALRLEELLDTADLCLIFGCSARTVYRWMAEFELRPYAKVGRQYLFTKSEVLDWYEANRPRPGRPPGS